MDIANAMVLLGEMKKMTALIWCFLKKGVMSKWKTI